MCIEEFVNGRRFGNNLILVKKFWKKVFWVNLENYFNLIIKSSTNTNNFFLTIFLYFECIRFERFRDIIYHKKNLSNTSRFNLIGFYIKFISENQRKLLKKHLKKDFLNKLPKSRFRGKNNQFSKCLTTFYENPFVFEKKKISCSFIKWADPFIKLNLLNFRRIIFNLSIFGVTGYDIFWIKFPKRTFHSLILQMILKKLEVEIKLVKKILKIEIKSYYCRIKQRYNTFKGTNPTNFEKIASIFSSGLTNLNNGVESFTNDVNQLDTLSIWNKYLVGYVFSTINTDQKILYEFLYNIKDDDTVSEYLKGGVIFGLSLSLKNQYEIERVFLQKCRSILKSKDLPIMKYSVCLALSTVISGGILHPEKSELFFELKELITSDNISAEGGCIAVGFLFLTSGSIFLLKELLLMIMETFDENKIKMLTTSISFIFCNNRNYSKYLFQNLIEEKNPQIRQGAIVIYSLGNFMNIELNTIKLLLSYLPNEHDDNVKFTLVSSIGFIFISRYPIIKEILFHFINHYNPFIRLGLCFSLTLSSLGLKNISKQIKILQRLLEDRVDFVSQGAAFCLGLVHFYSLSQRGVKKSVEQLKSIIYNSRESKIKKFGAIIGLSVIEIKKKKSSNRTKRVMVKPEILHLFLQYWSWLPNICFGFEIFAE